jgi:hypothetical protein
MLAVSWKTRWPGTTPAANHPGWPGGRRVYRRVGLRSLLAQGRLVTRITARMLKAAGHSC